MVARPRRRRGGRAGGHPLPGLPLRAAAGSHSCLGRAPRLPRPGLRAVDAGPRCTAWARHLARPAHARRRGVHRHLGADAAGPHPARTGPGGHGRGRPGRPPGGCRCRHAGSGHRVRHRLAGAVRRPRCRPLRGHRLVALRAHRHRLAEPPARRGSQGRTGRWVCRARATGQPGQRRRHRTGPGRSAHRLGGPGPGRDRPGAAARPGRAAAAGRQRPGQRRRRRAHHHDVQPDHPAAGRSAPARAARGAALPQQRPTARTTFA